jgi:hypothetical protein
MRFDPEICDKEAEREFRWFFRWTGEQTWRSKIGKAKAFRVFPRPMLTDNICAKETP